MNPLLAAWRLLRACCHVLVGLWTIRWHFPRASVPARHAHVQAWAHQMLHLLGMSLRVEGTPPAGGPLLQVANHVSWADILVILAAGHTRFVSKSDVAQWPVLGALVTGVGTLYIERERKRDALRMVGTLADALRAGGVLTVFPEGTTSTGHALLPFHANLLEAAIASQAPIGPVLLRFTQADGRLSMAPSFVGDATLISSIWTTLRAGGVVANISFLAVQPFVGQTRRDWAQALEAELGAALAARQADAQPRAGSAE